jgi:hypothetical protein
MDMAGVACGAVLVRKGRDQGDNNIEGKPSMEATRVDVFEWSKVHDRESLARPDPVIWPVESDRVEETGLRATTVTIVLVLRVAMSTERVWSKRASCGLQGKHPPTVDTVTPQGAVTARETVRRNRYGVCRRTSVYCTL